MNSVETPRRGVSTYNIGKGSCGAGLTALLFFVIALISLVRPNAVFAIDARADMSYQKTTTSSGGKTTESSSYNESYTFGLSHAPTSTIMILADVRLSKFIVNGKETSDTFPMFFLNYTPPAVELYYLSLGYTRNETVPPGGDPISISNMNASFTLPGDRWPSVSLFYNQAKNNDYLDPHKLDTVSINQGFNTTYGFSFLETATNLNYSFSDPIIIDRVGKTKNETQSHLVSAGLVRSFWDKKINTNANMGHSQSETTTKSLGGPQRLDKERTASEGLFALDITPTVDPLVSTPALIDNSTTSSAGIDLNGLDRNIGIRFTTSQSVFKIHLYINTADPNIKTYVDNDQFGLQLYTSSDGTNWTSTVPTVSYEPAISSPGGLAGTGIVFNFSETSALFFKVVNTKFPAGAGAINVTEIEAIGHLTSTPTEIVSFTTIRDFGGFGLSFSPLTRLNMSYNLSYDHSTQSFNDTDTTSIGQGVGLNSVVVPQYLNLSTSYSTSKVSSNSTTGSTETGEDSYSLSFSSSPLPALNASLNYGYSEALTGGETYSKTNSISGNVFMNLYKGVDLGFGSSVGETKDIKANSKTNSINSYGNLNLIPWRSMTIIVNGGTSGSTTETAGKETDSSSQSLNTVISYTPTRNIYLSASIGIEPTSSQTYNITWLPSRNIQTSARYGISGDVINRGADISWTPVSRLSLRVGYSGTKTDNVTNDHTDSVFASASLRL
ncbi:MAG: hypothetical protein Q8P28_08830 [Deltaproteobacteria bacterium]|nr:hypothetical protein [Deltaproteobacteria bacterium]